MAQSMILVGRVLTVTDFADSRLYAPDFAHRFGRAKTKRTSPDPGAAVDES